MADDPIAALRRRLVPITDADDPRVAEFRDIRDRDLRGREGRFIAEGMVVLRVLAEAHGRPGGVKAEKILLLDNRVETILDIVAGFPGDVPVLTATRPVIDRIAGFPIHRGVLAVGHRPTPLSADAIIAGLRERALVLAASGIANHDNVGGLFRNAAAFGADAVLLDALSCDPLYRKAIRVSVGAALKTPFSHGGDIGAILAALDRAGFPVWGLSPRGRTLVEDIPAAPRIALIVGTEGEGLPDGLMAAIRTARIAQAPGLDSLNLATAAGIALHQVAARSGRLT